MIVIIFPVWVCVWYLSCHIIMCIYSEKKYEWMDFFSEDIYILLYISIP